MEKDAVAVLVDIAEEDGSEVVDEVIDGSGVSFDDPLDASVATAEL